MTSHHKLGGLKRQPSVFSPCQRPEVRHRGAGWRGRALRNTVKGARPPFPVGACRPWCAWLAAAPLPSLLWSSHGHFPGCLGPRSPSEGTSHWTSVHLNPVGPLLITNQRHLQRPSSQMRLHSEVPGGPEFGGRRTTLHPSTGTYSSGAKEVVL